MITFTLKIEKKPGGYIDIDMAPINTKCEEEELDCLQSILLGIDNTLKAMGAKNPGGEPITITKRYVRR